MATKTQYGQGSCYYGSELILERLSPDEISKWQTQNSSSETGISDENQNKEASSENRTDFKLLAQELNVKNVKVSLPRISPSKFILDRDSTSPSSSYVDDESTSDNEVTINNKDSVQIPILKNGGKKRRSRSSSPSSVSTSSSREENPGNSNSKRLRRETSLPLLDGDDFFMKWI